MLKPVDQTLKVATLVCPCIVVADVLGAHSVFALSPTSNSPLVWKTLEPFEPFEPFEGMTYWPMVATITFDEYPDVDVLTVSETSSLNV